MNKISALKIGREDTIYFGMDEKSLNHGFAATAQKTPCSRCHISPDKIPVSPSFMCFQRKHLVSLHSDFESCF